MKRFLITFFIVLLVPVCAFAQVNEQYSEQLNSYDLSAFKDELAPDTYELLSELGLDDFDYESISALTFESAVHTIKNIAEKRTRSPVKGFLGIIVFILLSALFQSLKADGNEDLNSVYSSCSALIIAVILVAEFSPSISLAVSSVKLAGNFIFAFVPAFCAIVIASGGLSTAFSTNTMLLILSQGLNFIAANIFVPLINCFLAVGICSSIRSELNLGNLIGSAKKAITSVISIFSAVFVSILSMKTAVSAKADMLGIRSVRFVINTVVPVIGGSISEGLLSIQSYSSLIKTSVGTIGIIAIALVFLPAVIEITLWRAVLGVSCLVSEMFGDESVRLVLNAFKDTALLINVVLILSMVTTVISFGILIAARTA